MNFLQKFNRRFRSSVVRLTKSIGIDIQKMSDLDIQINKLQSIKNPEKALIVANELVHKYPKHPKPHLALAQCLIKLSDPNVFEQLDRYGEVRQEWLIQTGLDQLDLEFIWSGMVVGSLGNHYAIEALLKANQLELRPAKKLFLLLPKNAQLRNPALFEYFEPHLCVVRDEEAIQGLRRLESLLTLPLGLCLPLNEGCPLVDLDANRVEQERKGKGMNAALFTLSDNHFERGMEALRELGLPRDAWYVTLHVREPGYRGETADNTTANFRNANPLDYLKAIELIIKEGGWVFRMGDPSMMPLPPMSQVVDCAHHSVRYDWMDVFLGATCRFCIGTSSGYYGIPLLFGVPVLATNFLPTSGYYGLREKDLFLPRLLKKKLDNKLLSFTELMSPATIMLWFEKAYADTGLRWVENSPEVLEAATREMLERTSSRTLASHSDDDLQRRFKAIAEECGLKHGGRPVKALANISRDFLVRHAHLLGGAL